MTRAADASTNSVHVATPAQREHLQRYFDALREVCDRAGADADFRLDYQLVVEEACVNVMNHGFPGREPGTVEMTVHERTEPSQPAIVVRICDDGDAFDPLAAAEPDTTLSAEEREIGGLGVHLLRNMTDEQHYLREHGRNCLTLARHLPRPPEPST